MPYAEAPNISADAGDPKALSNPNSPEALSRRAKQAQAQAAEDQAYDAPPPSSEAGMEPPPVRDGFLNYVVMYSDERKTSLEISTGLFLALGVMLILYKAAPDSL